MRKRQRDPTYTHFYIHKRTYTPIHTHSYLHTPTYTHLPTHTYQHTPTYTHLPTHTYLHQRLLPFVKYMVVNFRQLQIAEGNSIRLVHRYLLITSYIN